MKVKRFIRRLFLLAFLSFGVAQHALPGDFSGEIEVADNKVILGQYEEAKEIYQKIIRSSGFTVVAAYAHYKMGSLYKRQNKPLKAKEEYEKGLLSLKEAGQANHQIGKYLVRALKISG